MSKNLLLKRCNKWCESFSWLRVDSSGEEVILICATCPYGSAWAKGKIAKASTQRSDLTDHVESVKHKEGILRCVQQPMVELLRAVTKRAAEKAAADADASFSVSYASWSLHVSKIAHLICKRSLSFNLMSDMCTLVRDCVLNALEEKVDPDQFREDSALRGERDKPMYANAKAAIEYATVLAGLEIKATVEGIKRAGCFGLSVDEGTDVSVSKMLAMSVRYVCVDSGSIVNRNLARAG